MYLLTHISFLFANFNCSLIKRELTEFTLKMTRWYLVSLWCSCNATLDSSKQCSVPRVMSTSKWPLKVSDERVQMYRARRNQYLSAAITDGDHEPEVDPYAFEEGDVKFTFSNKKDKAGGEREPGKKHKVRKAKDLRV